MGIVKKVLADKDAAPVSTLYSDYASVDLAESFHVHWRNCRFVMDHEEFQSFLKLLTEAGERWNAMGNPPVHRNAPHGDQEFLAKATIKAHPGSANPFIANEGVRVELIQWADFIHVHWKWVRFEFDYREFLEFADTIAAAATNLRAASWFEGAPRRIGTHHVACPRGRVDHKGDGSFWTERGQDHVLDDRHRTIFLDDADAERVRLPNARVKPDEAPRRALQAIGTRPHVAARMVAAARRRIGRLSAGLRRAVGGRRG